LPGTLVVALVGTVLLSRVTAAEPPNLRAIDVKSNPHAMLRNCLRDEMRPHFEARREAVKAIDTPEQFAERRQKLRDDLFRINGAFPEKTPLKPAVVGKLERDGYVIEKVIYQSRPGVYVTANLYLPKSASATSRVPGVLIPCGHSANGKAAEAYQSAAISLALNGMAVLIYDPIGQGERVQLLGTDGKPHAGSTTEHTLTAVGGWLVGTGTAHYRIWDGIRSLDYLASRPEIDPERLGCTGNSGGGTLTSYLMAFDDRIQAAAPSCYLTTLERLFDTIGPQDGEQNFPGQVALGIDHADYIALRAPRPTLMCVATQDYFDIDGAWTTFREAKALYGLLGHAERMDLFEYDDKHGFSKPRRQAAMRFLRRWLVGKDDNPEEPAHVLSTDAELQCTKTGQVLRDFDDAVSIFQVTAKIAKPLAAKRTELWKDPAAALAEARRLSGVRTHDDPEARPVAAKLIRSITADETKGARLAGPVDVLQLEWPTRKVPSSDKRPTEVPLPALLFKPTVEAKSARRPAIVWVSSEGKEADIAADGPIATLVSEGKLVLNLDVRGWGETSSVADAAKNRDVWFGGDFASSMLAIHLNRPLVGQRAEDVIAAVMWLATRDDVDPEAIEVVGVKHAGPVVLHAAAFEPRIRAVTTIRSIRSWSDVVEEPAGKNQLQNVVPFALHAYDLPDLVQTIAPRKVTIIDSVNPRGD